MASGGVRAGRAAEHDHDRRRSAGCYACGRGRKTVLLREGSRVAFEGLVVFYGCSAAFEGLLLTQVNDMVTDLTSMNKSGKLTAEQATQATQLLTKAAALKGDIQNVTSVNPIQLAQLASNLIDLQEKVSALKALVQ